MSAARIYPPNIKSPPAFLLQYFILRRFIKAQPEYEIWGIFNRTMGERVRQVGFLKM